MTSGRGRTSTSGLGPREERWCRAAARAVRAARAGKYSVLRANTPGGWRRGGEGSSPPRCSTTSPLLRLNRLEDTCQDASLPGRGLGHGTGLVEVDVEVVEVLMLVTVVAGGVVLIPLAVAFPRRRASSTLPWCGGEGGVSGTGGDGVPRGGGEDAPCAASWNLRIICEA